MAAKNEVDDLRALVLQMGETIQALKREKSPGERALDLMAERSAPKENPNYTERSIFAPDGVEKPALARDTFFCGSRCREDELTPAEVQAFNAITASRVVSKPNGQWTAEVRQNGTAQELHVDVPSKTQDDRMGLPSLLLILTEINGGAKAVDPLALAQRVALLEAQNAELAESLHRVGSAA